MLPQEVTIVNGGKPIEWPDELSNAQRLSGQRGKAISVACQGKADELPGLEPPGKETYVDDVSTPLAGFHPVVRGWFEGRFEAATAPQSR